MIKEISNYQSRERDKFLQKLSKRGVKLKKFKSLAQVKDEAIVERVNLLRYRAVAAESLGISYRCLTSLINKLKDKGYDIEDSPHKLSRKCS